MTPQEQEIERRVGNAIPCEMLDVYRDSGISYAEMSGIPELSKYSRILKQAELDWLELQSEPSPRKKSTKRSQNFRARQRSLGRKRFETWLTESEREAVESLIKDLRAAQKGRVS